MSSIDDLPVLLPRMSRAAYFRILLPKLLGDDIEKVIYLDSDTLCRGDIAPLWDTDVSRYVIGAVRDLFVEVDHSFARWATFFPTAREVRRQVFADYFNSGVMLMNLKRWRALGISDLVLDWRRRSGHLTRFHDQDALNAILANDWLQLSARWNFGSWFVHRSRFYFAWNRRRLDPVVMHFTGGYLYRTYRSLYHRYVAETEWKHDGRRFFPASKYGGIRRTVKWHLRSLHIACFPFFYGSASEFGLPASGSARRAGHNARAPVRARIPPKTA